MRDEGVWITLKGAAGTEETVTHLQCSHFLFM
jgi:hypothetical protein